uniref:Secreted protein n=1 Tax=Arcella intermedia TaxID=1963864 RepID=A0A6B2LVW6_9EUKA
MIFLALAMMPFAVLSPNLANLGTLRMSSSGLAWAIDLTVLYPALNRDLALADPTPLISTRGTRSSLTPNPILLT